MMVEAESVQPTTAYQVLIVDDDEDFAETLQEILADQGFRTWVSHNAAGALDALEQIDPHFALLDLRIGQDNGLELLRKLKEARPDLVCIMMTAFAELEAAVDALRSGAYDFLQKPLYPPALLASVGRGIEMLDLRLQKEAAYAALQSAQATLSKAQQIAHLGSWEWNIAEGGLAWSDEVYRIFGLKPQEFAASYEAFLRYVHPDDQAGLEAAVHTALESGAPYRYQHRVVRPDGTERIVLEQGEVVRDADGQPQRMVGTVHDVTERERMAEELAYSEERLTSILNMAVDAIITVDAEQKVLLFNRGAEQIFGYDHAEIIGRPLDQLIPERLHQRHRQHVHEFASSGDTGRAMSTRDTIVGQRKSGEEFPAEASITRTDLRGQFFFTVILRDVSDRVAAEAAVRESEQRFRSLIEGSQQGIVIAQNLVPVFANEAFAGLLGFGGVEEVIALGDLTAVVEAEAWAAAYRVATAETTAGQESSEPFEMDAIRRDGTGLRLEAFMQPVDWQGQPAVQVTLTDVTHRTVLENQLRQSQKMEAIGQLAGGVAHDFNNMLQIIRGYTELSLHKADADSSLPGYLSKVIDAADTASHLTRQLLAFSRQEVLKPAVLDVNSWVPELMTMLRRLIGEDVELRVVPAATPALVEADKGMLAQVLLNLCVNARDAMPDGGRIVIEAAHFHADPEVCRHHGWQTPGDYVSISVSDTGQGIPQEFQSQIFDPFFTTKEPGKGTGLGLSLVYGIVQQHQGMITLYSEPELGTTFKIYLPSAATDSEASAEAAKSEQLGGKETLLVVEDEAAVLELAMDMLEASGYRVLTATNGEEAVAIFEQHGNIIDLVITDVVMPRMGGRAAFEQIRAINPDVPVIFSTGYSANALDEAFVRDNEFQVISKPYSPNAMLRTIRETLDAAARRN